MYRRRRILGGNVQPRTHRDGIRAERTLANACVQSLHGTAEKAESPERDSSCSELHSIVSGAFFLRAGAGLLGAKLFF